MKQMFLFNYWLSLPSRNALQTLSLFVTSVCLSFSSLHAADLEPIAHWGFEQEESTQLESHGGVHRDIPGPRPPAYPDFTQDNLAVRLDGKGAHFTFADPGINSRFDFTNGDEITLEAWVKIDEINPEDNVYVIGKGRTGNPGFSVNNQNWALRLRKEAGLIRVNFLFSSLSSSPATIPEKSNWHRWTSDQGFQLGKEWHHIAISYRFGEPESLVGVIDGVQVTGHWDLGGPTRNAPVVDDDAIWIGSALGGTASNSFRGELDEISIYRAALPASTLQARYRGPNLKLSTEALTEQMPELGILSTDSVLMSFHEGMPSHARWLNEDEKLPPETLRWHTKTFLLDRLPQQYDSWGIRDDWKGPVLVRMAADITLAPGKNRFLMRVRGLTRLWVDGQVIARGVPQIGSQHGFEPITPLALSPKPGLRIAEHRQQEVIREFSSSSGGKTRVVLETLVGGQAFRTDPGETCVAIETEDGNSFVLLQPGHASLHLTDRTVQTVLAEQELELQSFDDQRRRSAAESQSSYWNQRHEFARDWARQHPSPATPPQHSQGNPIDAFLEAKIQSALAASSQTSLHEAQAFHEQVLPILRDQCFRCHGAKSQGGFNLSSQESALAGGDSGLAGINPGHPHDSEIMRRIRSDSPEERMPPGGSGLSSEQVAILDKWINSGATWPAIPVTKETVRTSPPLSDEAFLRRVFLDTVGVIPNEAEVREFLQDTSPDKRTRLIDQCLADVRWADHWTSYWMDVLAENPTLLNASLNTTGPFRWFIYESLLDNKPIDRFVTELILLRGSTYEGGSAGFGVAADNDAPFATKGQIIASAFLGIELQCARCHDSPYHSTKQRDLYALAAMLEKKPVVVPSKNRVPDAFFEQQQRESLIRLTLKPGEPVLPIWPFAEATGCADDGSLVRLMQQQDDSREKLAALITSPCNQRFSEVIVNRVWRRLIGTGIVEPPHDWEGHDPSHPELLKWLAQDLITHNYDIKRLTRLILTSQLYQREAVTSSPSSSPETQFFVAPNRRRMSGEQLVDSLFVAVGLPMEVEEMTFAPEAGFQSKLRLTLGVPDRAWKFASLANERDRPSLSLPRARAISDILEAFGWDGARQNPRTDRETDPNVLQPGILQNSDAAIQLTRASLHSEMAEEAVIAASPKQLLESLFLRLLSRYPTEQEYALLAPVLSEGFEDRLLSEMNSTLLTPPQPLPVVTWSNHLQPGSTSIVLEIERRTRDGLPPDPRLRTTWREAYEDVIWSVMNLSEFVWIP